MVALPEADIALSNLILLFKISYAWEITITEFQIVIHSLTRAFHFCSLEPALYLPDTYKPVMILKEVFVTFVCVGVYEFASNSVFAKAPQFFNVTVKYKGIGMQDIKGTFLLIWTPFRVHNHWLSYRPPTSHILCPIPPVCPGAYLDIFLTKRCQQLLVAGTKFVCAINQYKFSEVNLALHKWRLQSGGTLNEELGDQFFRNSVYNFLLELRLTKFLKFPNEK